MRYDKLIISGQRCTGKSTLLWDLQKKLAWPMFSISMFLRDYIRSYKLDSKQIEEKRYELAREVDQRIVDLLHGPSQCLIEAKVFHFVKDRFDGVGKVLLTASDIYRYKRAAYREGIGFGKAKGRVDKRESQWLTQMAEIYGFDDFFENKYYDLVVDTSNLGRGEVTNKVFEWLTGDERVGLGRKF